MIAIKCAWWEEKERKGTFGNGTNRRRMRKRVWNTGGKFCLNTKCKCQCSTETEVYTVAGNFSFSFHLFLLVIRNWSLWKKKKAKLTIAFIKLASVCVCKFCAKLKIKVGKKEVCKRQAANLHLDNKFNCLRTENVTAVLHACVFQLN